jgi:hypothetical protein
MLKSGQEELLLTEQELIKQVLPFLIPLAVIEVALLIIALVDLIKREHVRGGNKVIWGLVIVLINIIGPIVYLLIGRQEREDAGD